VHAYAAVRTGEDELLHAAGDERRQSDRDLDAQHQLLLAPVAADEMTRYQSG
jgi:hypothetical protein